MNFKEATNRIGDMEYNTFELKPVLGLPREEESCELIFHSVIHTTFST